MKAELFLGLRQFFGAYFNEDWMCEFETADEVVRSFFADSSSETVVRVKKEISIIIEQGLIESELQEFLTEDMGCCYCYLHEWPSGESWLTHVLGLLEEGL